MKYLTYFEQRLTNVLISLNAGNDSPYYRAKWEIGKDGLKQYAIFWSDYNFHSSQLKPIAAALEKEGMEITDHAMVASYNPSPERQYGAFTISVYVQGIGYEVIK